jgi:hypothetical protein
MMPFWPIRSFLTPYAFGDGVEDGGNEVLGVVGLLEDLDLLAKTGAVRACVSRCLLSDCLLIAALVVPSSVDPL